MRFLLILFCTALMGACSSPAFVGDAAPVPITTQTPDYFELPARFAVMRTVYGRPQPAGAQEAILWNDLAARASSLGDFAPLVSQLQFASRGQTARFIETARMQRFNFLILVEMKPSTGSADITLYHVGSGGVMATAQAVTPNGGQRGFWGGRIRNPARLDRATFAIAKRAVISVEEILHGATLRQR